MEDCCMWISKKSNFINFLSSLLTSINWFTLWSSLWTSTTVRDIYVSQRKMHVLNFLKFSHHSKPWVNVPVEMHESDPNSHRFQGCSGAGLFYSLSECMATSFTYFTDQSHDISSLHAVSCHRLLENLESVCLFSISHFLQPH